MRQLGVGISNKDLYRIPVNTENLSGPDDDNDGLPNLLEDAFDSNRSSADTDNDGFSDLQEIRNGFDPLSNLKLPIDLDFTEKLAGRILLQVESNGEAWYVDPVSKQRFFLGRPNDAFSVMRQQGLGATDEDIERISVDAEFIDQKSKLADKFESEKPEVIEEVKKIVEQRKKGTTRLAQQDKDDDKNLLPASPVENQAETDRTQDIDDDREQADNNDDQKESDDNIVDDIVDEKADDSIAGDDINNNDITNNNTTSNTTNNNTNSSNNNSDTTTNNDNSSNDSDTNTTNDNNANDSSDDSNNTITPTPPNNNGAERIKFTNFDKNSLPKNLAGDIYPHQYSPEGTASLSLDSQDAVSGNSLKYTVTDGIFYAQFLPQYPSPTNASLRKKGFAHQMVELPSQYKKNTYNRLSFWIKAPRVASDMRSPEGKENTHVGTYIKSINNLDEFTDETGNNHWYHQLNVPPTGTWTHVVISQDPHHLRSANGNEEHGNLNDPFGEGFNYFDHLTRLYISQQQQDPKGYPAVYHLDEFELYRENRVENTEQVYSLTLTYVESIDKYILNWSRHKEETDIKHEVRYSYQDIHEIGWDNAIAGPDNIITSPGHGGYNKMYYMLEDIGFQAGKTMYFAIKPQNSNLFTQISYNEGPNQKSDPPVIADDSTTTNTDNNTSDNTANNNTDNNTDTTSNNNNSSTTTNNTTSTPQAASRLTWLSFDNNTIPKNAFGNDYPSQYTPEGTANMTIDTQTAVSGNSLKHTVTSGLFYAQFNPQYPSPTNSSVQLKGFAREMVESPSSYKQKTYNRVSFWIKAPTSATPLKSPEGRENTHFGTYIKSIDTPNPYEDETNNNHWYHQLNIPPTNTWVHVVVNEHPHHLRSINGDLEQPVLTDPFNEGYGYFDHLTRIYISQQFGQPTQFPAVFHLDELEFYREPYTENDQQVYALSLTYVSSNDEYILNWSRDKNEPTVKHEVRYAYQNIHEIGWENATAAPNGLITPPASGGYNKMHYIGQNIGFQAGQTIYFAIKPENSNLFSQISYSKGPKQ
jgi:hypothetical protein